MKHYYLGLETDDGLTVVRRLEADYQKSKDVVDTMNKDMATTAYVLIGDAAKPEMIDLSLGKMIKISTGFGIFECGMTKIDMEQELSEERDHYGTIRSVQAYGIKANIEMTGYKV